MYFTFTVYTSLPDHVGTDKSGLVHNLSMGTPVDLNSFG